MESRNVYQTSQVLKIGNVGFKKFLRIVDWNFEGLNLRFWKQVEWLKGTFSSVSEIGIKYWHVRKLNFESSD
jgi:hypothetical protein